MKLYVKGFPELVSKELEIPNIGELLHMQFTNLCDIDEFYKNGSEFQKYLVDNSPILGKAARVGVSFQVQYLFPGTVALPDRIGFPEEWHTDFGPERSEGISVYRNHLLLTKCQCMTEFNEKEFEVDLPQEYYGKDNEFFCKNDYLLTPKAIEPDRIYSFDSHVHRAVMAKAPQLRFMFRLVESAHAPIKSWAESSRDVGIAGKGREAIATVLKREGRIVLNHQDMDENYYKNYGG